MSNFKKLLTLGVLFFALGYGAVQVHAQAVTCFADFSPDGKVGIDELLYVLNHWGVECRDGTGKNTPQSYCETIGGSYNPDRYSCTGDAVSWENCREAGGDVYSGCEPCTGNFCPAVACASECQFNFEEWLKKDACEIQGGKYLSGYHECIGIDEALCTQMGGSFEGCASVCRQDPDYPNVICTRNCALNVCSLPLTWEQCLQFPGHVILGSYPEQCLVPDGRTVIKSTTSQNNPLFESGVILVVFEEGTTMRDAKSVFDTYNISNYQIEYYLPRDVTQEDDFVLMKRDIFKAEVPQGQEELLASSIRMESSVYIATTNGIGHTSAY